MSKHKWDQAGERCISCGDKDWMAGPSCIAPKPELQFDRLIMPSERNDEEDNEWVYHVEIIKTYSKDGELVRCVSSVIPGEFKPDEATIKYWEWLDARRETTELQEPE